MKSAKQLSFMVFVLLMFVASQFAMTASSRLVTPKLAITGKQAIIVIRHGEDRNDGTWLKTLDEQTSYWKTIAPKWPKYKETSPIYNICIPELEPHESVTVNSNVGHGLSLIGESQAKRLQADLTEPEKVNLLKILTSATPEQLGPFAPVTRAITIDPSPSGATANPFDTIYPFLKTDETFKSRSTFDNRNLLLVNNQTNKTVSPSYPITLSTSPTATPQLIVADELQKMINDDTLLPSASDGGSTLLCWDGESLWGKEKITFKDPKTGKDETRRVFNPNSILGQLANQTLSNEMCKDENYHDFYPKKGAIIYIFTRRAGTGTAASPQQKYNMTIYSSTTPLSTNGLGVLIWRGTWNSNDGHRERKEVVPGLGQSPIQY